MSQNSDKNDDFSDKNDNLPLESGDTSVNGLSAEETRQGETPTSPIPPIQPNESNSGAAVASPSEVLGAATEQFVESFQDSPGRGVSDERSGKDEKEEALAVSEDVRKKYERLPDILFAPTLGNDAIASDAPRYTFRYQFSPNTESTWNVSHRLWKETTYGGMTRKIETVSTITRRWKFGSPADDSAKGTLPVEYFIDRMRLEQFEEGTEPISFDSETDTVVPEEFQGFGTEKMIGVVLERFQLDPFGQMTDKTITVDGFQADAQDSRVTVPFPNEAIAVGQSWSVPWTFFLKAKDQTVKTIKGIQRFRLENVTGTLATIRLSMTPLSLVDDPYLEGQLAEKLCEGVCRFDLESGRTLKTELEFSRTVPNAFGEATILVYRCRIVEERQKDGAPKAEE